MIPMVPFSPFAQLGTYATESMALITVLHDQLLARKSTAWQLTDLQQSVARYIAILDRMQNAGFIACNELADYHLLKRFCTREQDLANTYLCATAIGDMQDSLLQAVKTVAPRALRRGLYYLTKQIVAAVLNYKQQVAPKMCENLLKPEAACE